jgi:predicted flap endonuclease-1-like 5' DNA nuclease
MTNQLPPQAVAEAEAIAESITGVRQRALLSYDEVRSDELMFEAETLDDPTIEIDSGTELLVRASLLEAETIGEVLADRESGTELIVPVLPVAAETIDELAVAAAAAPEVAVRTPLPTPSSRARASTQPPPPPLAAWRASSRSSIPAPPGELPASPNASLADVQADLLAARRELARAANQMRARDAYLRELEHALEAQTRQLATWGLDSAEGAARLSGLLRGQTFRIAELESSLLQANAALADLQAKVQQHPEPGERVRVDLQAIRGIGPRFEEQLRSIGIATYEAVAALSSEDVQRIAALLRIRPERIERGAWIEQARQLCASARDAD